MYHLQFGVEKLCPTHSHALYLEAGYTDFDYRADTPPATPGQVVPLFVDVDVEIIPITLNYKYERSINDRLSWYAGLGAGLALVDQDISSVLGKSSFDDTVFYAQAFVGLTYNFSEAVELFAGARYIYMDDPDLSGISEYDDDSTLDDEILVELGVRYTF